MKETRRFSGEPPSAAAARRFATRLVAGLPPEAVQAIELMVSELATNCIRHTQTEFQVTVGRTAEQIRVEVDDTAAGTPRMRRPAVDEPTGRGLQIVELLSEAWGVEPRTGGGKTVWFTVPASPAGTDAPAEGKATPGACACA